MSYQLWNNYLIKNQNYSEKYIVFEDMPVAFLEETIDYAKKSMQPQSDKRNGCAVMMTNILAEPDWINIPCNKKIPAIVLCQKLITKKQWHHTADMMFLKIKTIQSCENSELFFENRCIAFKKHSIYVNLSQLELDTKNKKISDVRVLQGQNMETMVEYFTNIQQVYFWPIQFTIPILWNKYIVYKPLQTRFYRKLTWTSHVTTVAVSEYHGYMLYANKKNEDSIKCFSV